LTILDHPKSEFRDLISHELRTTLDGLLDAESAFLKVWLQPKNRHLSKGYLNDLNENFYLYLSML